MNQNAARRCAERIVTWRFEPMNVSSHNAACESAGKPDALQTLRDKARQANKFAKRLECVRLAGAFAIPRRYVPLRRAFSDRTTHPALGSAFTLIEIMVVVAIMAIVMTLAIPMIYQQLHPESMRKAVNDVMEACSHARARAILDGVQVDLVIRPADRQFDLAVGSSAPPLVPGATELFSPDVAGNDWRAAPRPAAAKSGGGGDSFFPVKLSDKFVIAMGINGEDY